MLLESYVGFYRQYFTFIFYISQSTFYSIFCTLLTPSFPYSITKNSLRWPNGLKNYYSEVMELFQIKQTKEIIEIAWKK